MSRELVSKKSIDEEVDAFKHLRKTFMKEQTEIHTSLPIYEKKIEALRAEGANAFADFLEHTAVPSLHARLEKIKSEIDFCLYAENKIIAEAEKINQFGVKLEE